MKKKKSSFLPVCIFIVVLLGLSTLLSYFFVWTHDDFGTIFASVGTLVKRSLYYGNGRYLGNFLVNLILPHKLTDAVFRGVCITSHIVLTAAVASQCSVRTLSVSLLLFVGYGNFILREAVIWGHGFYNFFPPVVLLLIAVWILKRCYLDASPVRNRTATCVLLALLGFCQQLFSENTTGVALLIAVLVFAVVLHYKRQKLPAAVYLAGAALGTFVMFALPAIMQVSYKMEDYRGKGIGKETLPETVDLLIHNLSLSLSSLASMFIIWTVVSYAMIRLLRSYSGQRKAISALRPMFCTVFVLQPFVSLIYNFIKEKKPDDTIPFTSVPFGIWGSRIVYAVFALFLVYLLCVMFVVFENEQLKGSQLLYYSLIGLIAVSVGGLLFLTIMGPRCLFVSACLLSVFVLAFLSHEELLNKTTSVIAGIGGTVGLVVLLVLMHSIWQVDQARQLYAREQLAQGKTTIEIIRLPHIRWLHYQDKSLFYKYYFNNGDPEQMHFVYIDYEDYLTQRQTDT